MRKVFSHFGFSIIEALVVSVLVAVMALSFATVIVNHQKTAQGLQQTFEANQIGDAVAGFLSDLENCEKNLLGKNIRGDNVSQLLDKNNNIVFSTTSSSVGDQIKINEMRIEGGSYPISNAGNAVKLNVYFTKSNDTPGGPLAPRVVEILHQGAGTISSCRARPPRTARCKTEMESTGTTSVQVFCKDEYKVYSCGWRDDEPAKNSPRYFYQLSPTSSNPQGGCYCRDDNSGGNLRCYALCCAY